MRIQLIDLFTQMDRAIDKRVPSWSGDWIFRRSRLELVDQALQLVKPDVLIFQNSMQRAESLYDSDQAILGAGALSEYQWQNHKVKLFDVEGETSYVALATAAPVKTDPFFASRSGFWSLSDQGYVFASTVIFEGQEIPVVILRVTPEMAAQNLWYFYAYRYIHNFLETHNLCLNRLVVAGEFWGHYAQSDYQMLLDLLQLKDSARSFCSDSQKCATANPDNLLYQAIRDVPVAARNLRILVHRSAQVFEAKSFLKHQQPKVKSNDQEVFYGLDHLEASPYLGWETSVRFSRCKKTW